MQDSYMPSSKRHEQYLAIYHDARSQNDELVNYLYTLHVFKDVKNYDQACKAWKNTDRKAVAKTALGRWKYCIGNLHDQVKK